jgi:hypothetical protein
MPDEPIPDEPIPDEPIPDEPIPDMWAILRVRGAGLHAGQVFFNRSRLPGG